MDDYVSENEGMTMPCKLPDSQGKRKKTIYAGSMQCIKTVAILQRFLTSKRFGLTLLIEIVIK
jgi:hypothetical protein